MDIPYRKALAVFLFAATLSSHAVTVDLPKIQVNGFATLAGVATDSDDITYKGASKDISFDADSKVGLQFDIPVNERLQYTLQLISKAANDYDVEAEWAYGAYQASENVQIRGGRLRIPFFLVSDSLEIGYSYPWVRPPIDTYAQFAFSRFSGIDSLINIPLGDSELKIHPHFGTSASSFEMMGMAGEFSVKNLIGLNLTWSNDWLKLRLGHTEGDYEIYKLDVLEPLADIMYSVTANRRVADQFAISDRHGQFSGLGVQADWENFQFIGEYNIRRTNGLMPDTTSWYTTFAYRFDNLLPHITFSEYRTDEDYSTAEANITNIDMGDPDLTNQVQGALNQIINFNSVNQRSVSLGVRYDILSKTSLKLELQRLMPESGHSLLSPPFDGNVTYSGEDVDDVDLITVAVDFIF